MAETLKKGTRVTGADRTKLASDLKKRYDAGESIRSKPNQSRSRSNRSIAAILAGRSG